MNHYLLSCSISADVRQSVQIKFDDLKLPQQVIDTLEANNTVSIRPHLSNALKGKLDALRVKQRQLYDAYCIHYGDAHFVTASYFQEANEMIKEIKRDAETYNSELKDMWESEYTRWQETANGILRPLFSEDIEYSIAFDAYMRFFPTREEYRKPIRVSVLGPLPVSLQKVEAPVEGDIDSVLAYENAINTQQVLEAAKASASDKALTLSAQLLDDLDVRNVTKIGRQQTGSDKKRGSWQITAEKLKLISDSVPAFSDLAILADRLLQSGSNLQSPDRGVRTKAVEDFYAVQEEIRTELSNICSSHNNSQGLEKLQHSLALSSEYKLLCEKIKTVESANALNLLVKDANTEIDIYEQRSKQLRKLIAQRRELIQAAGENLDELIGDINTQSEQQLEADF